MTLQQLKYFTVMAEVLHYTRAANQLFISQPSLSYAIAELEKELGVPLFERHGKQTRLTPYGEAFLPHIKTALQEIEKGQNKLFNMLDPALGKVNLGYIYSVGFSFIPTILEEFFLDTDNSSITFSFFQGMNDMLIEKLLDNSLDLVFAVDPQHDNIEAVPIFEQELFVIVPHNHRFADAQEVTLEQIKDEPLIAINRHSSMRSHMDSIFAEINVKPNIAFEVAECNAMAAFVSSNMGIAITPLIPSLDSYKVKVLKVRDNSLRRQISLLWPKGHYLPPSALRFREFVLNGAR
ncbi:MAG: LysR family transcriptional regulator [Bacillota bacterium]|nr:LysR family transcriptional regulator [Bacillota bacterium]